MDQFLQEHDDVHQNVIKNVKKGEVLPNFRALCNIMNLPYETSGNKRKAMIDEIERHLIFKKLGNSHKIEILEIYDTTLPKTIANTYFDNFLPIFEAFLEKTMEENVKSYDKPYIQVYTTKEIIKLLHLYNSLYTYLLFEDEDKKLTINYYTHEQMEQIHKILDYDFNTVYSSIVSNSLTKLHKNHHAEITRVWIKQDRKPIEGEERLVWLEYWTNALAQYREPQLSLMKANDNRNTALETDDFIYPAWEIVMGTKCFEYFKKTINNRKDYKACKELLNDKRISKINKKFQEIIDGWGEDSEASNSFIQEMNKITKIISIDKNNNIIYKSFDSQEELEMFETEERQYNVSQSQETMNKSQVLF